LRLHGHPGTQSLGKIDPKDWKPLLDFAPARGIAGFNDNFREPVQILMGLVGMVLLIAYSIFAATGYWFPKVFGFRLDERSGKMVTFAQARQSRARTMTGAEAILARPERQGAS